jgi:hypothetical protein
MAGFIFGPGQQYQTPEELARARVVAEALLGQQPVAHNVGEGLAVLGQAIKGRRELNAITKAQATGRAEGDSVFSALFGGGAGSAPVSAPTASGNAISAALGGGAGGNPNYRNAIAGIESAGSGDYSAVGPTNPKLGRALGRYQVMEGNLPSWSQEALGRTVTPEQFLADPKLQDSIFDHKFGSYVQQFGPEGAAQAWFAGPGGVGKVNRKDALGTDVGSYGQKFMSALGGNAPVQVASTDPGAGVTAALNGAPPAAPASPQAASPVAAALSPRATEPPPAAAVPSPAAPAPMQTAQAAPQQQSGTPSVQQLLKAAQDPWLSESQRGVVNMMLKQQMEQASPAAQLEIEKGRLDAEKTRLEIQQMQNPQMSPADKARLDLDKQKFEADRAKLMELSAGTTVFDPKTRQPVYQAPEKADNKPAGIQEYEYAKQQGFPGTYADWEASKKGGMSLQVDPETGAVTFQQGGNIKPMTEGQSKDTTFAVRAEGSLPNIDKFGDALTSLQESTGGKVPVIGNYLKSPEYQQGEQAGKEFLQAILRKDTGAAITPQETEEYGTVYLPRPGDSKEVLAQKKASRTRALDALKAGMTPQALLAQEQALQKEGKPAAPADSKKTVIDGYTIEEVP